MTDLSVVRTIYYEYSIQTSNDFIIELVIYWRFATEVATLLRYIIVLVKVIYFSKKVTTSFFSLQMANNGNVSEEESEIHPELTMPKVNFWY